jgi:hypothetical protein
LIAVLLDCVLKRLNSTLGGSKLLSTCAGSKVNFFVRKLKFKSITALLLTLSLDEIHAESSSTDLNPRGLPASEGFEEAWEVRSRSLVVVLEDRSVPADLGVEDANDDLSGTGIYDIWLK